MKARKKLALFTAFLIFTLGIISSPAIAAQAGNFAKAHESWFGAKWNGYVQIQASYNDHGRHAKQGYHRFTRKAGPALDTGRMYTKKASSAKDKKIYSRSDTVWDSALWGDSYTTHYYYDFIYW